MGDRPALEAQCGALLEREPVEPAARELCDPAGARRARGDAGAAVEAGAVDGSP